MSETEKEYVLGTGDDELARLALQHRLWADTSTQAWKRAGIGPGSKVIDVGAGPGHASYDLAQLVTGSGLVSAVDESTHFIDYVNGQAKTRGLPQLKAVKEDVQELKLGDKYDAAYCRWVLCWLADPARALQNIRKALKPGGKLVIHDYFNWKAMAAAPRSLAIEKMVQAAIASFVDRNGDVDIVARLLGLLRANGFEVVHFDIHQRTPRGGGVDSMMAWPLTWWRTYGPKLVGLGKLSAYDYSEVEKDLDRLERDPDTFFFCPPLFEIVAVSK